MRGLLAIEPLYHQIVAGNKTQTRRSGGPRMYIKSAFTDLRRYQKRAASENTRYYIFMNSMSDIFEKSMPVVNAQHKRMLIPGILEMQYDTGMIRDEFFKVVDECPNLIFLLLTKRPSNILKMIPPDWIEKPRPNVMFGTSIVDQPTAENLLPQLLQVPGKKFLSMEPLVERVDLFYPYNVWPDGPPMCCDGRECGCGGQPIDPPLLYGVDWVIVGGESGGMDVRPMNSEWVKHIKAACDYIHIPFFFKQWGNWMPLNTPPEPAGLSSYADGSGRMNHYEQKIQPRYRRVNGQTFYYTNSHNEDGLLEGVEHKNFPI